MNHLLCKEKIACKPFSEQAKQARVSGLDFGVTTKSTTALEVVIDSYFTEGHDQRYVAAGSKIYVLSDQFNQQWAKDRYKLPSGEGEFIAVPASSAILIDFAPG
jgi:hypothetical protein